MNRGLHNFSETLISSFGRRPVKVSMLDIRCQGKRQASQHKAQSNCQTEAGQRNPIEKPTEPAKTCGRGQRGRCIEGSKLGGVECEHFQKLRHKD